MSMGHGYKMPDEIVQSAKVILLCCASVRNKAHEPTQAFRQLMQLNLNKEHPTETPPYLQDWLALLDGS